MKKPREHQFMYDRRSKEGKKLKDHEVDPSSFLRRVVVKRGRNVPPLRLIFGARIIAQQLSILALIYISFILHSDMHLETFEIWMAIRSTTNYKSLKFGILGGLALAWKYPVVVLRGAVLFTIILAVFCPLLRTLTETVASDTVFVLVGICALVHLYTYDYYAPKVAEFAFTIGISTQFNRATSLNAGFLMCLLLSSRLKTSEQVASFLLSSVVLLVMIPSVLLSLSNNARVSKVIAEVFLFVFNLICFGFIRETLRSYDALLAGDIYSAAFLLVLLICPAILFLLNKRKKVIIGPWDLPDVGEVIS